MTNLRNIDLNLLVSMQALLDERSVTRAARRVGLSQPAMSHALGKLRELFDDPLLVRVGRTMQRTARADALAVEVVSAVDHLQRLFAGRPQFDPATSRQRFHLAATDYVQFVLLPGIHDLLRDRAPGVSIAVKPVSMREMPEALRTGEIDLALGLVAGDLAAELHCAELFSDRFVGLARKGHPRVRRGMSRATYAALPHLLVSPRGEGGGIVDSALAEHGLCRDVAMVVPQFLVAPHIVARSDCVVTMAERVARPFARLLPLRVFDPPVDLAPMVIGAIWHARTHQEPAHVWFRAVVERLAGNRRSK